MSIAETSLSDLQTQTLANKSDRLNTTVPLQPRAFLRVESVVMAASLKALEKRSVYGQKQALATTALREGLRAIAADYGEDITPATKAQFTCRATAGAGDSVSAGAELTSDSTGAYYTVTTGGSHAGGYVSFVVDAQDAGEDANLAVAETLTFTSSSGRTVGVGDNATIQTVDTTGEDEETVEDFRRRVLALQRKTSGGGNNSDYRDWSEAVSGVLRAYVYSGKPIVWYGSSTGISFDSTTQRITHTPIGAPGGIFGESYIGVLGIGDMIQVSGSNYNDGYLTVTGVISDYVIQVSEPIVTEAMGADIMIENASLPGDRTIFIESTDDTVDGIPTESLLESVRDGINYDSDGAERPGLGDPDSTLYVEPISRVEIDVEIYNLDVDSTQEEACKDMVEEDLTTYFSELIPYIEGLDFEFDRNDVATLVSVSKVVQDVLDAYGASADNLVMTVDGDLMTSYQLEQGQLGKIGTVTWTETSS